MPRRDDGHPISVTPFAGRVRVHRDGVHIADSGHALALEEADYPTVFYLPRGDVAMDRLTPSDHRTHCPHKGEARYFSLDGEGGDNAVWSYETPYPAVAAIKGHLAFYPDKVELEVLPPG
ncbi:MAG: DUF427 domain-containing protein [Sphingomonadaceae bacterium]|nr:DUF427 domain-containing protein [Sphingomonadaceae bacterium]